MKSIKTISIIIPYNKKDGLKLWFQRRESFDELNGMSEFPGGKIEIGETPLQGAIREFKEEVGVDLQAENLELLKIHNHSNIDNFIFYIYGVKADLEDFPCGDWHSIENQSLKNSGLNIPPENYIFMEDILKTL